MAQDFGDDMGSALLNFVTRQAENYLRFGRGRERAFDWWQRHYKKEGNTPEAAKAMAEKQSSREQVVVPFGTSEEAAYYAQVCRENGTYAAAYTDKQGNGFLEEMLAPVSVIENVPLHARSRKVDMLFRLGSRCHNERVGDINGMAAGITVIVAIERGDGLLFHLIALPVEDEVLEDGDGRCAHGFSFLPWGSSVAAPFAVYKYSRTAYQQAGEPYTPYILHIKAKEEGHPPGCPVVPLP